MKDFFVKDPIWKLTPKRIAALWKRIASICEPYVFDCVHGVSTRGVVDTVGSEVSFRAGDNWYVGSQWLPVRRALKDLRTRPSDVFVDIGSGKGKTLLIAGRLRSDACSESRSMKSYPSWRNIIYSRRGSGCRFEVDSINVDARTWPIPDDVSVVFLLNPFTGETFRTVVGRIFESYDRTPRELHIIYDHPLEHVWLLSTGRVVVDNARCNYWPAHLGWWRDEQVIVSYRVTGTSKVDQAKLRLPNRRLRSRRAYHAGAVSMHSPDKRAI